MNTDLHTATAEQLAEYVAGAMGYHQNDPAEDPDIWSRTDDGDWLTLHELWSDLNLIADAMPPGWVWELCRDTRTPYWMASKKLSSVVVDATGNERLDRLRLAALAWEVESKG